MFLDIKQDDLEGYIVQFWLDGDFDVVFIDILVNDWDVIFEIFLVLDVVLILVGVGISDMGMFGIIECQVKWVL